MRWHILISLEKNIQVRREELLHGSVTQHNTTSFLFVYILMNVHFVLYFIIVIEFFTFPSIVEIESNGTASKSLKIDSVIDCGDSNKLILR